MANRYYNKLEYLNERKKKMKKVIVFRRKGRWYYGVHTDKRTARHPSCSDDGYLFKITAILKGIRNRNEQKRNGNNSTQDK